jgi:periplasmic protein TonB
VIGAEREVGVGTVSPLDGIRSILFRPDLVAVVPWPRVRRPPAPVKRLTPWRPRPTGEPIERARGGAWFSDRIFVEAKPNRVLAGLTSSIGTHALVIALAAALPSRVELIPTPRLDSRLVMPATLLWTSPTETPVQTTRLVERSPQAPVVTAPPAAGVSVAAPIEEPSSIEPETGTVGSADGIEGGVPGGLDGEIGPIASSGGGPPGALRGPLRVSGTIGPPRKIKDVKPVYPQIAVFQQARGTVVIEITIGTDGKVQEARIVHAVPQLDQAALEAVRQWEYEPTRVNGVLVALAMTVIVNFTIQ